MKKRKTKKGVEPNPIHVKSWVHQFASPKEHQEFLINLAVGAEFKMRNRALVHFYGKDLVSYKLAHNTSEKCTEFLRILSKFMTDCLEDECPPSWQECDSSFWEELIFTFFPHNMKISKNNSEVDSFLLQLKNFVKWLDRKAGTSWSPVVGKFAEEARPELAACEQLLNRFFLNCYPNIFQDDWNYDQDVARMMRIYDTYEEERDSLFEVTGMINDMHILIDLETERTYYVKGIPANFTFPGMILNGLICKYSRERVWTWFLPEGIYPKRGKKYLCFQSGKKLAVADPSSVEPDHVKQP